MDLAVVGRVGVHGVGYTAAGITFALTVGTLLGRKLRVSGHTSLLITVGTAICGGSAIAAVAPTIDAKENDVSVALVSVFLLNGLALFLFPFVARRLHLDEHSFGLWCALAIHDTSSVVGAAAQLGDRALEVATVAKLARALWILPLSVGIAMWRSRAVGRESASNAKPKRPWFIAGFLAFAAIVTLVPALHGLGHVASLAAHRLLALTLFLIGLGLSRDMLRKLSARPFGQAVALWVLVSIVTLTAIRTGIIT
jgi:uncharacterized integral membrane protein (TIGR00698 family)